MGHGTVPRWARQWPGARSWWIGYLAGGAGVACISALIGLVPVLLRLGNISMLYIVVVLATAVWFGRGPAIFASAAAFLTFDWFFVPPYHTFNVANPDEWLVLLLFLVAALITGHVAAEQRRRAYEAERREQEAALLYDVVRLMGQPNLNSALGAIAERLLPALHLSAIAIEVQDYGGVVAQAAAGEASAIQVIRDIRGGLTHVLSEGQGPTETQRGRPGTWTSVVPPRPAGAGPGGATTAPAASLRVVPVIMQGREVGNLLLVLPPASPEFTDADNRLLSAVATQLGLAVERIRLRREATESEILRRADELKTALLNAVSHDLRTPLASIVAAAGSLRQRDVAWSEEERYQLAEGIEEEAQRLNRLVGNLLDMSRIQGGSLRPQRAWHDVGSLIDDVLGRLAPLTAKHGVRVFVENDLPPVCLDYVEIGQVLSNLVENAAKYSPAGTDIKITARLAPERVRIEVANRGPDIPPADLPHIFEPFYRGSGAVSRSRGTGLGLAVAEGLVRAHDGHIWAENRTGGGARFVFTLPVGQNCGAADAEEAGR